MNIGMIHDIQWPGPKIATTSDGSGLVLPASEGKELLRRKFGQPVDIVLFGDTHHHLVCALDGILVINPGSPTYPARRKPGLLGTVGILQINDQAASASLVDLTRN